MRWSNGCQHCHFVFHLRLLLWQISLFNFELTNSSTKRHLTTFNNNNNLEIILNKFDQFFVPITRCTVQTQTRKCVCVCVCEAEVHEKDMQAAQRLKSVKSMTAFRESPSQCEPQIIRFRSQAAYKQTGDCHINVFYT